MKRLRPGLLLPIVPLVAGLASAAQPSVNAGLAGRIGLARALLINSVFVLVGCLVYVLLDHLWGGAKDPDYAGVPWHYYLGGLFGLVIIVTMPIAVPRLGATVAVALWVLGMGVGALVLEHVGAWGILPAPLAPERVLGVLLIVAGVVLLRR